jgi:hypothetical protein
MGRALQHFIVCSHEIRGREDDIATLSKSRLNITILCSRNQAHRITEMSLYPSNMINDTQKIQFLL